MQSRSKQISSDGQGLSYRIAQELQNNNYCARYADQKASNDHIASSPVQGLISMFGHQPAVFAAPPKIHQFEYTSKTHQYTRPEVNASSDPFIVFASATQTSRGSTAELTDIWTKVVEKAQADEPKTLLYALLRDKESQNQLGTIEAYADEAAFEEHCKSSEVGDLVTRNKQSGGEMGYVALKMVTGWLSR